MATRTGLSAYIPVKCGVPVEASDSCLTGTSIFAVWKQPP
jgi:hypothetical protein